MDATFPGDLRYTSSDEWIRREGDEVTSGVTSFAADQLGDVVYVEPPKVGREVSKGESFGEIESVKAVSDLYAPLSGTILAVNSDLEDDPGLVNQDPYGRGWIVKLRIANPDEYETLLDAAAYEQNTQERH